MYKAYPDTIWYPYGAINKDYSLHELFLNTELGVSAKYNKYSSKTTNPKNGLVKHPETQGLEKSISTIGVQVSRRDTTLIDMFNHTLTAALLKNQDVKYY